MYLSLTGGIGNRQDILKVVGKVMLLSAFTTMGVFAVLLFSQVVSPRQMALLALFGVGLALVFSWLLISTIVKSWPYTGSPLASKWLTAIFDSRHPGLVVVGGWVVFLLLGLLSWPQLRYNGDLCALDIPNRQVIEDEKHFSATWGEKGEQAFNVDEGETLTEAIARYKQWSADTLQTEQTRFQNKWFVLLCIGAPYYAGALFPMVV